MIRKKFIGLYILFIFLTNISNVVFGQNVREITEVLESMHTFLNEGNWGKVSQAIDYIQPLFQIALKETDMDIQREIKKSVSERNKKKTQENINVLTFIEMQYQMQTFIKEPLPTVQELDKAFKLAYLNYLLLSPKIQETNFQQDQLLKKKFRSYYQLWMGRFSYTEKKSLDRSEVSKQILELQETIKNLLPELKSLDGKGK